MSSITRLDTGKRYRVTAVVEGVADGDGEFEVDSGDAGFYKASGAVMLYGPATLIEEIKPEYMAGAFYRDDVGDTFQRTDVNTWRQVYRSGQETEN